MYFGPFKGSRPSKITKFSSLAPSALARIRLWYFGGRRAKKDAFVRLCDWQIFGFWSFIPAFQGKLLLFVAFPVD